MLTLRFFLKLKILQILLLEKGIQELLLLASELNNLINSNYRIIDPVLVVIIEDNMKLACSARSSIHEDRHLNIFHITLYLLFSAQPALDPTKIKKSISLQSTS